MIYLRSPDHSAVLHDGHACRLAAWVHLQLSRFRVSINGVLQNDGEGVHTVDRGLALLE